MFPVATNGGGVCNAFPDVCKTPAPPAPPVPIPYPNIAQCSDGSGSTKVKTVGKETLRKGDLLRMSSGDEAGSVGGLVSSKIKGKAEFKTGSGTVKVEGKDVAHLTASMGQNGGSSMNQPGLGVNVSPGQTTVILIPVKGKRENADCKVNTYKDAGESVTPSPATSNAASNAASQTSTQARRQASEAVGDSGAQDAANAMMGRFGGPGSPPAGCNTVQSFSGPGVVDVIGFAANAILVFEAKGGGSPLGSAAYNGARRARQGTPQYLRMIARRMASSGNAVRRAAGQRLLAALNSGHPPVRYAESRTDAAGNITVREFDP